MTAPSVFEAKLRHSYPGFELDVSVSLTRGIGVLFGPSGAGKSVTLRLIAGLNRPDQGSVSLNGRVLSSTASKPIWIPPQQRRIGYVFQHHALFPHMTVLQNVMYGARGMPKSQADAEARKLFADFQLQGLENSSPERISGGQKQRVTFARAMIGKPDLLLLDEPFSALDGPTRKKMRESLVKVVQRLGIPAIIVTHDLDEAVAIGDVMFVCIGGRVHQVGRPSEVLKAPSSEAVRELVAPGT